MGCDVSEGLTACVGLSFVQSESQIPERIINSLCSCLEVRSKDSVFLS